MWLSEPLPFIEKFVNELNEGLQAHKPDMKLSAIQRGWLGFCLMGIILTNSICWARFERMSLGRYKIGALSWMFRQSKIAWATLLQLGVGLILQEYGIREGILVTDDSDHQRSKKTPKLHKTHKIKDKGSGGYMNGQNIVLLLLVTDKVSIPVGFALYEPNPIKQAWIKADKRLQQQGIPKKDRPDAPPSTPQYPNKSQLVLQLMQQFRQHHAQIKVKAIVADALYGQADLMDSAAALFDGTQVISQLRQNQNIQVRHRFQNLTQYFATHPGVEQAIRIRGQAPIQATVGSLRVKVCAHGKKRFVIALKYAGEAEYRYLVATDLSWRTIDIIQAYSIRWIVEVFIEDWKSYEGWAQLAKQTGVEGASYGLTLSLLLDLCLLLHPRQLAQIQNKLPAYTVGSLLRLIQMESLLLHIEQLLQSSNPAAQLTTLAGLVSEFFILKPSGKHMSGRDLGRLESTPSLLHRRVIP
ncbi:MAG: transposase [Leptolyngbyaceae cyanobacterium CRU_2_3]|nr:transposase [Leptolyngbyaceae cyanobacterium CRU_2_3]